MSRSSFEKLLAARFAGTAHLVTGWWALGQAGLTSQDVREVVVLTTTHRRDFTIAGRKVRVSKVEPDDIWGGQTSENGLTVARPERAFCDCAGTRPARIPPARIAEALDVYLRSTPRAAGRLGRAAKRTASPVVARRLGYLVELIAGERVAEPLHDLIGRSRKADALDPGDEQSPIVTRWQIRTRLAAEDLLEHRRVS